MAAGTPLKKGPAKGSPPAASEIDWAALGEEFTLVDLLTAGVEPGVASQLAMVQALGKMQAAPTSLRRPKRVFGLDGGADDAEAEEGSGSDDGAPGSMPGSRGTAASLA